MLYGCMYMCQLHGIYLIIIQVFTHRIAKLECVLQLKILKILKIMYNSMRFCFKLYYNSKLKLIKF